MTDISQIAKWYNSSTFVLQVMCFTRSIKIKVLVELPAKRVSLQNAFPYKTCFPAKRTPQESKRKKVGDSMFCDSSVEGTCRGWSTSYSLVSYFQKLGILLWTEYVCLCMWNISLLLLTWFCSWVLQLITQVLNVSGQFVQTSYM